MDMLNDDCQLLILKLLNLQDQLMLFEALKEEAATSRLRRNLCENWKNQRQFEVQGEQFCLFERKPELLQDFLTIVSSSVRKLKMGFVKLDALEIWRHYQFPVLQSLEYRLYRHTERNQVMQLMSQIFPDLRSLTPAGSFDLMHLANWSKLRKLNMNNCYAVSNTDESARLFDSLQLLEELKIRTKKLSVEDFKMFCVLPKLRKLVVNGTRQYSRWVLQLRAPDIERITLLGCFPNELKVMRSLINLREMTLLEANQVDVADLQEVLSDLPKLQRLDIEGAPTFPTESSIRATIDCCPSLKIMNATYPYCTVIEGQIQYHNPFHPDAIALMSRLRDASFGRYLAKFQFYSV